MKYISKAIDTQRGAVSLFVVIFAALLMTIVTVSFIQLMLKDQQQATLNDLSQSANDSALAGVEDAKRLLLLDQACRNGIASADINCANIANALAPEPGKNETSCNALPDAGIVTPTNGEVIVQQSENDRDLDQAYTCVKIGVNTADYKDDLELNRSTLVPINGVGTFDRVEVSWFSSEDKPVPNNPNVELPINASDVSLPRVGTKWQPNHPPLLRTQLVQTGGSFSLSDFDDSVNGKSNTNTLYLYPAKAGPSTVDFASDTRRSPTNVPRQTECKSSFTEAEYVCTATILLPAPIDGNTTDRNAYLRLTALYNGAHFRIKLKNGSEEVFFNRAQPEVDATGRANDVFRRVKARVELKGDFTYPEVALDMLGDLCKNFTITDTEAGYSNTDTCNP